MQKKNIIFVGKMIKLDRWTDSCYCYSPHEIGVHHDMQSRDPEHSEHIDDGKLESNISPTSVFATLQMTGPNYTMGLNKFRGLWPEEGRLPLLSQRSVTGQD